MEGIRPAHPHMEATRLDEEPVSKTGEGLGPWAFESPRFRHAAIVQR